MKIRLTCVVVVSVVLVGCGGGSGVEAKAAPKFDKAAYAAQVEKAFEAGLMDGEIGDMCDPAFTHWACFYDGIEAQSRERIDIKLTTDGGWSKGDLKAMGKKARRHWFNAVGLEYPKLDTIVSFTNGVNSGTSYRRDNFMLNK